jgi:hypothetical protein
MQVAARHMEYRVYVEVALIFPDIRERDVLSMTNEPGGLMIQGGGPLLQGAHPERNR